MVFLLAWLMGAFRDRMAPGEPRVAPAVAPEVPSLVIEEVAVERAESAVGTIRAVRETAVAARILGRVKSLAIERAGQAVAQGQPLAELDAADLQAAVEQARAALAAATTRLDKAGIDLNRTKELVSKGVAATDRLDSDSAAFRAAQAQQEQARQGLAGAESALAFATILAPIDGIVVDKKVQVGDVVQPGQEICTLYDPTRLQLVAVVREELAGVLSVGQQVSVRIDALDKQCLGAVAEIVPEAQAQSRAFEVKVVGPCQPGIVTGMFGRLIVPLGTEPQVRIPRAAVASVGQLDFVVALDGERRPQRRYVRLGGGDAQSVAVLSGLRPGERIVADLGLLQREGR